ncbi:MAG: biotin/lipoyl-containing protein [Candidatus Korobacteraceae bacterium]|jgi:biotin carboxyl carrier protein
MTYEVLIDGTLHSVELEQQGESWLCRVDGHEMSVDAAFTARDVISMLVDNQAYEIKREYSILGDSNVLVGPERFAAQVRDPRSLRSRRAAASLSEGPQKIIAPMPGKVIRILLGENSQVEVGQGILVVEAMKMQNEIKSPKKGLVQKVMVTEGGNVNAGDTMAIVE